MFFLWPDPPKAHKRRLRMVVQAQLGAPPASASAVGVARRPLVHAMVGAKAGLEQTGRVRARAGPALPETAGVVAAPLARVTEHGAFPSMVEARIEAASYVPLHPPRSLKRLFEPRGGASFLGEGSPESELLAMVSSATLGAAARAERGLAGLGLTGEQASLLRRVGELALGESPLPGFWGDSSVVDFLRLRLCRGHDGAEPKTEVRWDSFLFWAGRRLASVDLASLPSEHVPTAAAALLSVQGPKRTFDLLLGHFARGDAGAGVHETANRLALRCALAGTFSPTLLRFLLPRREQRTGRPVAVEKAWEPALLALHAYRVAAHDAGSTLVTAAIVATIVRDQVREVGRRAVPHFEPREWGGAPLSPEMEWAHRQVVGSLGSLLSQHWWTYKRPWPDGWCGPDAVELERRLVKIVGDAGWPAHDLFLDDALAVAACHALQGHTPSALSTLAAVKTPPVFVPVRDRLHLALERGVFGRETTPLVSSTLSREFQGTLDRLRHTPDPAEFGSPDWRRDDLRGRLLSRLQQQEKRGLALALRTVLGKAFADLDRFWLCPPRPDAAALAGLAAWLDRRAPVVPNDADFIHFLETECRRMNE